LGAEGVHGFLEQFELGRPLGRNAAAAQGQTHAARKRSAQEGVGLGNLAVGLAAELAAREKEMGAGRLAGFGPHQGEIRSIGRGHVLQGEFVDRGSELAALDEIAPGGQAQVGHAEVVGADLGAQTAEHA